MTPLLLANYLAPSTIIVSEAIV